MLVNGVRYQLNNKSPLHRNRITFIQVGNPLIFASGVRPELTYNDRS